MHRNLVLVCFAVLIVCVSTIKIADYDFWWHMERGEVTYDTGSINPPDSFSYTHEGNDQFGGEWLADLVIFLSYKAGGLAGANALKSMVLILTFLLFLKTYRNTAGRAGPGGDETLFYASVLTLAIMLFAIRFRLYIRPFLFSYLFVAAYLCVISGYEKSRDMRLLYMLPVIELLWANMSKGAFYGPVILTLFVAGEFVHRRARPWLVWVLGATVLASLISPETYGLYLMPLKITAVDKDFFVGEHQPLTASLLWGYGFRYTAMYQLLVLGSVVYLVLFRGWRSFYHVSLFVVFFLPSLSMVRMIDFFSLVAGLFFITPAARAMALLPGVFERRRSALTAVFSAALVVLALTAATTGRTYAFGVGVKDDIFPEGALAFLDRAGITGRVFNSYPFGGYIIWRSPDRKVFIDGRGVHYLYTGEFFNSYLDIVKDPEAWDEAEKRWGFETAIVEYDIKGAGRHFPAHLNGNPGWALVYWDNHSAVYLKRTPGNRGAIEGHEYRVAKPTFYDFAYLEHYLSPGKVLRAIDLLKGEIALNPSNQEPRLVLAFLLYNMKTPEFRDEAFAEVKASLRLKPDLAMEHAAAAILYYEKGLLDEAGVEVEKALRLSPGDEAAMTLKKRLEEKAADIAGRDRRTP